MIGRTLEHYRLDAKLGEGGMGVVYKAHDSRLNRTVAIKVLPPERVADPVAKQRFMQEARAASALNHPGVVTIHDIRSDAGIDFIVMEYVEGQTLDALIPAGGMGPARTLRYVVQIADALARAHAAGILHRDLKPSNVMVTPEDRIKVLDFGLAKLLEPADSRSEATTFAAPLTEDRVVLGTVAYMSPEQAEGRTLDARSDIFSFGVVLYEMLTGQRPFTADSRLALLNKIVGHDPPSPGELVASIPPELDKAVLRCLRKDPGRRYQTMADLKVALEDLVLETAPASRGRPAARALQWRPAWVAVLLIALAAAYAGRVAWLAREPAEPLRAESLTTLPGAELYPSLSPDGNHVAFTWTGPRQTNADIYVQQIGAGSPLQLTTDPRSDSNPVWSPDGRWIAFLRGDPARPLVTSDREVRLIAPLGGPERKLMDVRVQEIAANSAYLAWCPDSRCLIVTDAAGDGRPDALFVVSLDTGDKRQLTTPAPPVVADTDPSLSPDGARLLFIRRTTWAVGELHVLPLRSDMTAAGEPRHLAVSRLRPENATWLPDGREILVSTGAISGGASLWRLPASGDGTPARLPFVGEDGVLPSVSRPPSGRAARLVYVRSFTDDNIWRIDILPATGAPAAAQPAVAIASTKADIQPQISPDGRRVAFASTRSGAWEIWVSDADGANPVQLTSLQAPTGTGVPHWSPDGRLIAFASDAEGQFDIFVVASAGGKPRNLTSHPAMEHVPGFSRDGKWIYFSSARSGSFQVWRVPVSGGDPVQVTTAGGWASEESPDGADLYFTTTPAVGALTELWRVPASGGEAVKVLDGMLNGAFAVLGRGIYYIGRPAHEAELLFFENATRRSVMVSRSVGAFADVGGLAVSTDGRIVLYARLDSSVDDLMLVDGFR